MRSIACIALLGLLTAVPALANMSAIEGEYERAVERMAELDSLVGQWSLTSVERTSDGDALQAVGVRICRWALGGTAIRCDDTYHGFGWFNGQPQPVAVEDSLFYLTFNDHSGMYEYTYYSPDRPEQQIVPASYDRARQTLTGMAWLYAADGQQQLTRSVSRFLDHDRILEKLSVAAPDSGRETELLEVRLERRDGTPSPVIHF